MANVPLSNGPPLLACTLGAPRPERREPQRARNPQTPGWRRAVDRWVRNVRGGASRSGAADGVRPQMLQALAARACAARPDIVLLADRRPPAAAADITEGPAEAVLWSLQAHPECPGNQAAGAAALANLCATSEAALTPIGALRAVRGLRETLFEHRGDPEVVRAACLALTNIVTRAPAAADSITDDKGVQALLAMARAHARTPGVVAGIMALVWQLSANVERLRPALREAGVGGWVLEAFAQHPNDASVAQAGVGLLAVMMPVDPEIVKQVVAANGCSSMGRVLAQHHGHEGLAHLVARLLEIARRGDERASMQICEPQVLTAIVGAMQAQPGDAPLHAAATLLLQSLAHHHPLARQAIIDVGIPGQLHDWLVRHMGNAGIALSVASLLASLMCQDETITNGERGKQLTVALVAALRRHMRARNGDVALILIQSLRNLLICAGCNRVACLNTNGMGVLLLAMRTHRGRASMQGAACSCLRLITAPQPYIGSRVDLVRVGGVHDVLEALRTHLGDEVVRREACALLEALHFAPVGTPAEVLSTLHYLPGETRQPPTQAQAQAQTDRVLGDAAGFGAAGASLLDCPLLLARLAQPVIVPSGFTYERAAIEHWVLVKPVDPNTRHPLYLRDLIVNRLAADILDAFDAFGAQASAGAGAGAAVAVARGDPAADAAHQGGAT